MLMMNWKQKKRCKINFYLAKNNREDIETRLTWTNLASQRVRWRWGMRMRERDEGRTQVYKHVLLLCVWVRHLYCFCFCRVFFRSLASLSTSTREKHAGFLLRQFPISQIQTATVRPWFIFYSKKTRFLKDFFQFLHQKIFDSMFCSLPFPFKSC